MCFFFAFVCVVVVVVVVKVAAISAEEWFAGKDADPVTMSMLDVFIASQAGKEGNKGGSVLRQASRRLADKNDPHSTATSAVGTQSASMSRLNVMKPPHSAGGSSAPSHEPSPQPPGTNGTHASTAPTTYSVLYSPLSLFFYASFTLFAQFLLNFALCSVKHD